MKLCNGLEAKPVADRDTKLVEIVVLEMVQSLSMAWNIQPGRARYD